MAEQILLTRPRIGRVRTAKAGAVRVTLALKGRALKTLRKRGRLPITVRTTFKPSGGGPDSRTTSTTTFRLASPGR